jgi:hypothetical protein
MHNHYISSVCMPIRKRLRECFGLFQETFDSKIKIRPNGIHVSFPMGFNYVQYLKNRDYVAKDCMTKMAIVA